MSAVSNGAGCVLSAAVMAAAFCAHGEVLDVPVATSQTGYTADQLAAIAGGTVTEIRKTGAGTLVSKGIASFAGVIRVADGVMQVEDATGLGTSAGETIVEKGATLHFNSLSSGYTTYKSEKYVVAGCGSDPSTNGAIRITGATCQLSHLELSDDAALYSGMGYHFYDDGNSTMDMGGHTLALVSAASGNLDVEWKLDGIDNPGHLEITGARYFWPYTAFPGGGGHEIRLYGRTGLIIPNANGGKTWTLARCGTGAFYQMNNSGAWDGPFENRNTSAAAGISVASGRTLAFNGPLRGAGAFMKDANLGTVVLNGTNTFTSVFEAKGGTVILGCRESAAGSVADRFNFTVLTVKLGLTGQTESHVNGWTGAEVKGVIDDCVAASKKNVSVCLHAASGDTFRAAAAFDGTTDYSRINVGAVSGGDTAWVASFANAPKFNVNTDADLVFTRPGGSDGLGPLGALQVQAGAISFADAGYVDLDTRSVELGANKSSAAAALKMSGDTVFGRASSGSAGQIGLPHSMDTRGVYMEVSDGAVVTNRLQFSVGSTASAGALYLRGGKVVAPYTGTYWGYFGGRGQGFIEVSGDGRFQAEKQFHTGVFPSGAGQLNVSGRGVFAMSSNALLIGEGGTGVVYQTGGRIAAENGMTVGSSASNNGTEGFAAFTVSGHGATNDVAGTIVVNNRSAGCAVFNLNNGGAVRADALAKSASASGTAKSYVNFDGGVFVASKSGVDLFGSAGGASYVHPDAVTVYGGGAVVDTAGFDVSLSAPLAAPAGRGIASITLDGSFSDIVAPPVITISGDGRGASAVAEFDSAARTVTGIVVTSPGWGYTAAGTTVTASYRGYPGTVVPCSFTLTGDMSGSAVKLVKRGEGSLSLASGALPANAVVSVEGGSVSGEGLAFSEYASSVAEAAAGRTGKISAWPAGAVLSIGGLDAVDETAGRYTLLQFEPASAAVCPPLAAGTEIPSGWKLVLRGAKVQLVFVRGLLVTVR